MPTEEQETTQVVTFKLGDEEYGVDGSGGRSAQRRPAN